MGLQVGRQGGGRARYNHGAGTTSGEHAEQENNTKRAARRQRGGEGREEREKIHVRQRGLKGWVAWHGQGPPRAAPQDGGGTGREHQTEARQVAMQCCSACMQGGGNHAENGAAKKKNADNTPQHHKETGQKRKSG